MKQRTCLYRFLGECPYCKEDYDPSHHPNNLDCPKFRWVSIVHFVVVDRETKSRTPPTEVKINKGA